MQNERNPFRGVKLFFIAYFALLVLVLTFVGFMNWMGYKMIDISIQFALLALLLCSALIAGGVFLVKRVSSRGVKVLLSAVCGVLVVVIAGVLMMAGSMTMFSGMPVHYTTLTSPQGRDAVVLRSVSMNKAAADARRVERLAADPSSSAEEYEFSDLGYVYTAHPRIAVFFYDADAACEGSVEIGCSSEAQLMYDWSDDHTLHMYVENPEAQDGGELTLILKP